MFRVLYKLQILVLCYIYGLQNIFSQSIVYLFILSPAEVLNFESSICQFFFFFFIIIYFWLHWVFAARGGLSLVAASGGHSSLRCTGFSLPWPPLLQSTGSKRVGLTSCGTWAQQLWLTGSAAPQHVGSSRTRARTRVPCIGRRIPNHCTTREALGVSF